MENIEMRIDVKLKFFNNEVYYPYNPITHILFQFSWKKILKVFLPVDVSFMSENSGKNEFCFLIFSNISLTIKPKDDPNKTNN